MGSSSQRKSHRKDALPGLLSQFIALTSLNPLPVYYKTHLSHLLLPLLSLL
jgi:hypothetical protein